MARVRQKAPLWLSLVLILVVAGLVLMLWIPTEEERVAPPPPVATSPHTGPELVFEEKLHPPVEQEHKPAATTAAVQGIALIVDDVGYDLHALRRLINLPFEVAIAILPDAPKALESARLAHAAKRTVMLHLPMEPSNPKYQEKMTSAFLKEGMDRPAIAALFRWALTRVPYAEGVNNHMGSLLTTERRPMEWVMALCREKGLFFIDSKTAGASVAAATAADFGLAWGERRIFLDHSTEIGDMELAWAAAQRCAKRKGGCIVIAHPYPETLQFLEQHVSEADYALFRPVHQLLHGGGGA